MPEARPRIITYVGDLPALTDMPDDSALAIVPRDIMERPEADIGPFAIEWGIGDGAPTIYFVNADGEPVEDGAIVVCPHCMIERAPWLGRYVDHANRHRGQMFDVSAGVS